jgi:hypothetical protein
MEQYNNPGSPQTPFDLDERLNAAGGAHSLSETDQGKRAVAVCIRLLDRLLSSTGLRCAMVKPKSGSVKHRLFSSNEKLARFLLNAGQTDNVYFCTATLKSKQRKGETVAHRRCLHLDIDLRWGPQPGAHRAWTVLRRPAAAMASSCPLWRWVACLLAVPSGRNPGRVATAR